MQVELEQTSEELDDVTDSRSKTEGTLFTEC